MPDKQETTWTIAIQLEVAQTILSEQYMEYFMKQKWLTMQREP